MSMKRIIEGYCDTIMLGSNESKEHRASRIAFTEKTRSKYFEEKQQKIIFNKKLIKGFYTKMVDHINDKMHVDTFVHDATIWPMTDVKQAEAKEEANDMKVEEHMDDGDIYEEDQHANENEEEDNIASDVEVH